MSQNTISLLYPDFETSGGERLTAVEALEFYYYLYKDDPAPDKQDLVNTCRVALHLIARQRAHIGFLQDSYDLCSRAEQTHSIKFDELLKKRPRRKKRKCASC